MAGRPEVDDLDPVWLSHGIQQHDVLRLEICVDQPQLFQLQESREHLLRNRSDVFQGKRLELVLFEEVVQVLLQHLEDQAGVVLVREALVGADEIELVGILLAEARENGDLDLTLSGVGRMVLEDFDRHDFVRALLPALGHLTKGSATKEFKHLKKLAQTFKNHSHQVLMKMKGTYSILYIPCMLFCRSTTKNGPRLSRTKSIHSRNVENYRHIGRKEDKVVQILFSSSNLSTDPKWAAAVLSRIKYAD